MSTTKDLIKELEKNLEFKEPIRSEMEGVWSMPIEHECVLSISDLSPGYSFQCTICDLPTNKLEEFLTQAMTGNLFGQHTEGAVLGLNEEGQKLTLAMENRHGTDYKQFELDLEAFLAAVDYWFTEAQAKMK